MDKLTVMPPHPSLKAGRHTLWNKKAVVARVQVKRLRGMCLAYNGAGGKRYDYLGPHHLSNGKVVWKGVVNCARMLNWMDVSDTARKRMGQHLLMHYRVFDKKAPDRLMEMVK